jgi:lipopolysaccharide transport protein LptA
LAACIAALLALTLAGQVVAEGEARPRLVPDARPVELTAAGGLSLDLKRHVGFARGEVVIRRDDVTVCCDEAEARYGQGRIERVACKGRVVIVRPDGTRARADRAVFVAAQDSITLEGRAVVWAEDAKLSGEQIVYDIGADRVEVLGGESRLRYQPNKLDDAPSARVCPPLRAEGAPRGRAP